MKVVILSALGNEIASRCISSFLETTTTTDFDLYLIRERDFREQTLNFALSITGTDEDIIFVGDDIVFTPGWYDKLMANYNSADILGLSMLYLGANKVQDRGYDLVKIDDRITLEAKDRGLNKTEIVPFEFGYRACDSLCGCFMLVKAHVFRLVPNFSENGQNRWGEFIFTSQARQQGATVAVLDHFLYHAGESTKSNKNISLRSTSYQIERQIWEDIMRRYINPDQIQIRKTSILDPQLISRLEDDSRRVLFLGIGTVTEIILNKLQLDEQRLNFCSGLSEEAGLIFHGKKVKSIQEIIFDGFDWIIITPLYIGEKLYRQLIMPNLNNGFNKQISVVEMVPYGDTQVYRHRDITP